MSVDAIFYTILVIMTATFVLERTLSWLNLRSMKDAPPPSLEDLYDAETYQKSQAYHRTRARMGLLVSSVSFVAMFVFFAAGGFGWLDELLRSHVTEHPIRLPMVFLGILYLASELLSIPLSLYSTFVIEEKYGFNKMTIGTWVGDKLKGLLLTLLLGGPLILLLLWMINTLGSQFWLWFWGISTLFLFLMNILYPTLIVPVFNKLTPLEPGPLKTQIEAYGERAGFPLSKVMIMDGSKRSSRANAFFAGLGKTKRVVLFDTLIEQNETEELIAVLAHEIGHFKKRHILMSFVAGTLQFGLMLFILSL